MYEYKDTPYSKVKKYEIRPLNKKGFEKYIGYDSHNANYVSRINPKVFKEIVGMDYESITNKHFNQIKDSEQQIASQVNADLINKTYNSKEEENKGDKNKMIPSINMQDSSMQMQKNKSNNKEESKAYKPKLLKHNQSMKHIDSVFCMSPTMFQRPNLNFYQIFHRKQSFKDKYGYEKQELTKSNEDRYSLRLQHLKNIKLKNDEFNSTHSSKYYPLKRYCGFTSYCVPRTDDMKPSNNHNSHSTMFNRMKVRLERSISCGSLNNCKEFEALKKENEDMKQNLGYQTSKDFLSQTKLPNVVKIADTKKLIRQIGLSNSKDMGEKYNPFSNVYSAANRTKRNYTGSLFLH